MSTIPLIFMTSYYLVQVQGDMEERIGERQTLLLNNFANQINLEMEQTFQLVHMLAQISNIDEERGLLYSILKENALIEEIVVLDEAGLVSKRVSRYQLNKLEEKQSWFPPSMRQATIRNPLMLSEVQFNIYGQPVMKVALPIADEHSKEQQATVGVTLQLQKLIGEISSYYLNEPGYVFMVDSFDRIIAHQDYTQLWQQEDFFVQKGEEVIRKSTDLKDLQWHLVLEQPTEDLFAPMYRLVRDSIFVALFIIALISVISIYAGLYFVHPIEILQRAMKNIKHGAEQRKINVYRKDEFGELAKSFNEMSQEISEKTDQLLQEKERLNIIVSSIGAGLAVVRSDYQVTWMNETLKGWLNTNEALPCYKLFNNKEEPCCDCPGILENNGKDINEYLVKKDEKGRKKIFRHRVYPLKHSANEESLIVIEDITEEKEMEEALIQADKLSALGLMASSFAHEVNNPLATIKVYAEDLLDRMEEEETVEADELQQYLKIIDENTDRCKKITRNLLNFSRKSEWSIQDIDVNEVVQSSIELVGHALKKKQIQLETNLKSDLPFIKGDALNLMQVFVNIMNNGIDAMEESEGTLSIETKFVERFNHVVISISDTGEGIAEENLSKVFDPFYTTKPLGKGTGLGLSVCYGLLEQLGGTISINSEIGKGTTFEIKIPTKTSIETE